MIGSKASVCGLYLPGYLNTYSMGTGNATLPQDFLLLGFPGSQVLQLSLFMLFLVMYILIVSGNMAILMLVRTSHQLHTPMYFFLSNLSFLEIWYTKFATPVQEQPRKYQLLICLHSSRTARGPSAHKAL